MSCLCRIRQTRLNYLCSQFKRTYFQVSSTCLSDYVPHNKIPSSSNYHLPRALLGRSNEVFDNVRFFAVPVQFQKKEGEESNKSKGPRLNGQIKSHMIRLVTDDGHEVVPLHAAIEKAKRLNLDLVEVDRNANPIVCKIMDYHKEKYQQQLKEKERSKSKAVITVRKGPSKEIRFSPKIEQKDLQMKADMAKRLMERGYRVKCMVIHKETEDLLPLVERLHALIEDVACVESGPRVEKSQTYMVVRHIKFGPPKKGVKGAAAKSVDASSSEPQKSTSPPSTVGIPVSEDSGSENDSQSTPTQQEMKWSLSDANGSDEKIFDFSDVATIADRISDGIENPVSPNVANSSENRYSRRNPTTFRQPGPDRGQMPQRSDFIGPSSTSTQNRYIRPDGIEKPVQPNVANSSENRYSRQDPTRFRQPGPDRGQMPQQSDFRGPSSNSAENRYNRPGLPRRHPPGAEHPGPDTKSFNPLPRREIPKQNPMISDSGPPPSYGIFSNPNASLPRNHGSEAPVRSGNGFTKTQILHTENSDSPPTTGNPNRWGLFNGEGSNVNGSRTKPN